MDPKAAPPGTLDEPIVSPLERPRASHWLWRPWYAKLWWAGVAIYWTGKLGSHWSPTLGDLFTSALAGYLNIAFYPLTAVMILGVKFMHAWMDYRGLEWAPPVQDRVFPRRSVGGYLDPMADPLDPRSPRHSRRHHKL